jgi:hypothetical protein
LRQLIVAIARAGNAACPEDSRAAFWHDRLSAAERRTRRFAA